MIFSEYGCISVQLVILAALYAMISSFIFCIVVFNLANPTGSYTVIYKFGPGFKNLLSPNAG
jgi:hypothetical protein